MGSKVYNSPIKYVIEITNEQCASARLVLRRERPTGEDWDRLLVRARIDTFVDLAIASRRLIGSVKLPDPLEDFTTGNTKLHAFVDANRLTIPVQFLSTDVEIRSIAFRIAETEAESRYLAAHFDDPIQIPANQIVRLSFYSPAESERRAGTFGRPCAEQRLQSALGVTITAYRH